MGRERYLFLCKLFAYNCSDGVLIPLLVEKLLLSIIAAIGAVASWLVR